MSNNLPKNFSETLREQLDERECGNQCAYVGDMYSEAGFSHTGGGKRPLCADCHLEPRPGQVDNLFELHAEYRPKDVATTLRNRKLCQVCKTRPRRIMFTPCNHFYSCETCAKDAANCAMCHQSICRKIDIYRS